MTATKRPWHVEDGANSHLFDGRLMDAEGECVGFVDIGSKAAALIVKAVNCHDELVEALEQALVNIEADEAAHGRLFGVGNVVRAALTLSREATP